MGRHDLRHHAADHRSADGLAGRHAAVARGPARHARGATTSRSRRSTPRSTSGPTPTGPTTTASDAPGHRRRGRSRTTSAPARSIARRPSAGGVGSAVERPRGRRSRPTACCFRTGTFPDPTVFHEDFAALAPELVDHLARPRRPAGRHRHAQRRPVRLEGPAGPPRVPRPRHGHPRRASPARPCPRASTS